MTIKLLRTGFTESTLLFMYWCEINKKLNLNNNQGKINMIKWLYTTSGYYDKTIMGDYFNAKHSNIKPPIYLKYLNKILHFFKNSDRISLWFHNIEIDSITTTNVEKLKNEFLNHFNSPVAHISQEVVYNFIADNSILIISPFSPLFKQQIDSGNCRNIYENFPNVKNVAIYQNIYTFFNNGPHNNILETCDATFHDIMNNIDVQSYDYVLISCGAYSLLFAEKFYNLGKHVCTIGGELSEFFGVLNNRNKNNINITEYWIQVPEEYRPKGYMKIEEGTYW